MNTNKRMLFLTNFSEACFQALPAVAEWMDREKGQLTILHVAHQSGTELESARERLHSFFAEADRYSRCERVLLTGKPAEAIIGYCRHKTPDVVFAPASQPSGLPRIFHQSLRARLVREGGVKLWTRGRGGRNGASARAPKHVAHAITGHAGWVAEAVEAAQFAAAYQAKLHFLYLAPWPEVHEGTVAEDLCIARPEVSTTELQSLASMLPVRPELHTSMGDGHRDLIRLLLKCDADVAFLGERHVVLRGLLRVSMNPDLDGLDCEVVCYPKNPGTGGIKRLAHQPLLSFSYGGGMRSSSQLSAPWGQAG